MMWRLGVGVVAIAAGAAVGAFVFKMVGEEQIGGSVKTIAAKFGFVPPANASGTNALDFLDKIQPGSPVEVRGGDGGNGPGRNSQAADTGQ